MVDLLFFPTGGGKTEAYLGLAAFAMVLRRLRDPSRQSAGVSVLMRYTLRLLTLDQLDRAATLICALELASGRRMWSCWGSWPFELGPWVGQSRHAQRDGPKWRWQAVHRAGPDAGVSARQRAQASPIPLEKCPWCGWKFSKDSFRLLPNANQPTDLRVMCEHRACAFYSRRQQRGLPILAVDEPIYRRLPAF